MSKVPIFFLYNAWKCQKKHSEIQCKNTALIRSMLVTLLHKHTEEF